MKKASAQLDALYARKKLLEDAVERLRAQVAEVEFAIRTIEQPESHALFSTAELEGMVTTTKGSFKGLREKILETLRRRQKVMTGTQIAEAMYSYSWAIPFARFQRRVIVQTSAMYKNDVPPPVKASGLRAPNKEVYWALPEWLIGPEELMPEYYPETTPA